MKKNTKIEVIESRTGNYRDRVITLVQKDARGNSQQMELTASEAMRVLASLLATSIGSSAIDAIRILSTKFT